MKKTIILMMAIFATVFTACKKEQEFLTPINPPTVKLPPTLKKDTTLHSMVMIVPKTDTIVGSWLFDVKDALGVTAIGGKVIFAYSGAFRPSTGYRNVYYLIKDGATVLFRSETKLTVVDGTNSFNQPTPDPSFNQAKTATFELHAEVLNAATDGIGADDQCTPTFELIYQSDGSGTNKTLSTAGQTMTFSRTPTSTIETSIDPTTPVARTITGNQEVELIRMRVKSIGGSSVLDKQTILLNDINAASVVSTVKIYDTASGVSTPIGFGTVSGQSCIVNLNINLPENVEKTFLVKVLIGNITLNASSSDLTAISDKINYRDVAGNQKVNDVDISSKIFHILKSTMIINSVSVPGNIQNGVRAPIASFTVKSVGGPTASKQFRFDINLIDNGIHIDTLSGNSLGLEINGVPVTNATFTNNLGQVIDTLMPGNNVVYVTATSGSPHHEWVNPLGFTMTYTLFAKLKGYIDPNKTDIAKITLIVNDNPTTNRYVNSGTAPNNITAKLFSSAAASSLAVVYNNIWSDYSAGIGHSFEYGSGTEDAKNASEGLVATVVTQVLIQP